MYPFILTKKKKSKHDNYADTYPNVIIIKVTNTSENKNPWSITVKPSFNWLFQLTIYLQRKWQDFLRLLRKLYDYLWLIFVNVHVWHYVCKMMVAESTTHSRLRRKMKHKEQNAYVYMCVYMHVYESGCVYLCMYVRNKLHKLEVRYQSEEYYRLTQFLQQLNFNAVFVKMYLTIR